MDSGYKMTEVGMIPEDWVVDKLESFFSYISYGFTNPMPVTNDGVFLVTAKDINEGEIQYESARKTPEWAYEKLITDKSRPVKNDLLLTKDGTLGRLAIVDEKKICINQSVAVIRPNNKIDPVFLKKLLESNYYQKVMLENAGGSTIKHIYITIVNLMPIGVPPTLAEQKAIATALSDVDVLISSLDKLIEKKKAIKQGAMQELLTGKTRLAGFGNGVGYKMTEVGMIPVDWNIHSIGEISTSFSGGTPSTSIPDYYNGNINWITSSELNKGRIRETEGFISQIGLDNSSAKIVEKGTFLLAMYGATAGVPAITEVSGAINQAILAIISGKVGAEYLFQFFSLFKESIINTYTQGGQPNLSGHIIKSINIPLPPTLTEQKTIASALSDMDSEIEDMDTKRDKYKQIKQGMMQELLTGKTRLV